MSAADTGVSDPATVVGNLEDENVRSLASEALAESRSIPNRTRQVADVVSRLRNQQIDRELARLSQALARPDLPMDEGAELLRRQRDLRERKGQPLTPPGEFDVGEE